MTVVAATLNSAQTNTVLSTAQSITLAATPQATGKTFTFFAAFDGTRNDRDDLSLSGDPYSTNVGQIEVQVRVANIDNPNVASKYYPGVGTSPTWGKWDPTAAIPTGAIVDTAIKAYTDFNAAAVAWLKANPGGNIDIMLTTASRGGATGAVFSQLVFERGVVDQGNRT